MLSDASVPAVILGCHRHGGLAIVRSLGRLGVPVYAVHPERITPAFFSRYCRGRLLWDVDMAPAEASLRFLKGLAERIRRRSILVPTSDLGASFVAENADRLREWFVFPDQQSDLIRALCSKKEMYFLAKKWNVPTPETAFPRSLRDVEEFLATARLPVLLKAVASGPGAPPARLIKTKDELLAQFDPRRNTGVPRVMVQEYIPGPDEMTWTFNGYFERDGQCRVAFTGRKLRNYPAYFGQGSLGVCVRNERVEKTTIEFMQAIGYRGALDLGYRYDERDDRYKVNDINPRVGAMFRLFVGANGMDVVRALYQDMTGQPVVPATIVEGRRWIVEDRDWLSALRYWRDGNLTLRGWRDSLRGVQETSFFAKDDPLPIVGALANAVRAVPKGIGRLRRLAPADARRPREDWRAAS
jgi:D-aspartate ligase